MRSQHAIPIGEGRMGINVAAEPELARRPLAQAVLARTDGVDVSHHQAGALNFVKAKASGLLFAYHKASEGTSFRDDQYGGRRSVAFGAGLPFGGYHFARPSGGADHGEAEARFFLQTARPKPGDLRPALDLEVDGASLEWVKGFVHTIREAVGIPPIIYTSHHHYPFTDNLDCPLWVPRYSDAMTAPILPQAWSTYTIWQWSNGVFPHGRDLSVDGIGLCDLNRLHAATRTGAKRLLAKLIVPPPAPPPPPKPKGWVITVAGDPVTGKPRGLRRVGARLIFSAKARARITDGAKEGKTIKVAKG